MTQIDAAAQLAALIRRQMDRARTPAKPVAEMGASSAVRRTSESRGGATAARGGVAGLIAQRVQAIPADDPDRERKAFRVFLESVLLAELGSELINDPGFYQLVEQVHLRMEADPDLADAIQEAAAMLLRAPQP